MPVRWIPGSSFFGNSYLVGNVLVDAAVLPTQIEPFRNSIRTIVLTHCHFDHIAYVNEIAHMCNAEVCIHRLDAHGLSDDARSLSMNFGTRSPGRVPDRILEDGDMIGDLHVIHTPGHTPGSICLYKEDEKALMSGDTVFTDGGFGRFDFPGGSRIELARSIELLCSLDVDGLYPGHGSPVQHGGTRHIEGARALLKMSYV